MIADLWAACVEHPGWAVAWAVILLGMGVAMAWGPRD